MKNKVIDAIANDFTAVELEEFNQQDMESVFEDMDDDVALDSIGLHLKEIRHEILTQSEEQQLAIMKRDGTSEQQAYARNRLITHSMRLVVYLAKKYNGKMDMADLLGEGYIGLCKAADKFQPDYGRFSTLAFFYIKQQMVRAIQNSDMIRIPVNRHKDIKRIRTAKAAFMAENGYEPTFDQLYEALQAENSTLSPAKLLELMEMSAPVESLSRPVGEDEDFTLESMIRSDFTPYIASVRKNFSENLHEALEELEKHDKRQAYILRKRYGLDGDVMTLEQLAADLNITRERVRQLQNKGIIFLRKKGKLEDYKDGLSAD